MTQLLKTASFHIGWLCLGYAIGASIYQRVTHIDATNLRLFVDGGWMFAILAVLGIVLLGLGLDD